MDGARSHHRQRATVEMTSKGSRGLNPSSEAGQGLTHSQQLQHASCAAHGGNLGAGGEAAWGRFAARLCWLGRGSARSMCLYRRVSQGLGTTPRRMQSSDDAQRSQS